MPTRPEIRSGSCSTCGTQLTWNASVDTETGVTVSEDTPTCSNPHIPIPDDD